MITKLTIVCLCMTASAMFGLRHTNGKRARVRYFASCVQLTDALIAEISFRRDKLTDALLSFAYNDKTELRAHIEAYCAAPFAPFAPKGKLLKTEEKRLLSAFFAALGTSDAQTQVFELENYKRRFEELYAVESEAFRKTGTVGLKLSVLFGIAVGVLIL